MNQTKKSNWIPSRGWFLTVVALPAALSSWALESPQGT
jgi:hypothetical protein